MSSKVDNFLTFSTHEDIAMSEAGFCIENQQSMMSVAVEEIKQSETTEVNCQDGRIGKDCYESFTENLNTSELVASRPLDQV